MTYTRKGKPGDLFEKQEMNMATFFKQRDEIKQLRRELSLLGVTPEFSTPPRPEFCSDCLPLVELERKFAFEDGVDYADRRRGLPDYNLPCCPNCGNLYEEITDFTVNSPDSWVERTLLGEPQPNYEYAICSICGEDTGFRTPDGVVGVLSPILTAWTDFLRSKYTSQSENTSG